MGTHKPGGEPDPAPGETLHKTKAETSSGRLEPDSEPLMEELLARCLSLPRDRIDAAVDETCRKYTHLAARLRQRYLDLVQFGILEQHEGEQHEGGAQEAGAEQ